MDGQLIVAELIVLDVNLCHMDTVELEKLPFLVDLSATEYLMGLGMSLDADFEIAPTLAHYSRPTLKTHKHIFSTFHDNVARCKR